MVLASSLEPWRWDRMGMASLGRRALLALTVMGVAAGLGGCRDDEQGRPLLKKKGVYEGPKDEPFDQQHLDDLKSRAAGQKF